METSPAAPSKPDHSDQKATMKLIESLSKLTKQPSTPQTPKTSTRKAGTSSRKKRAAKTDNHPKITEFFTKDTDTKRRKPKPQPLDVKVKKDKPPSSKRLKRNSSFDKYGIAMPSFEKIVADHKRFEEHKDSVKQLDVFDEEILDVKLANDCLKESVFTGELLDCKHLSFEQLSDGFGGHLKTLRAIMSGEKFSQRHNIFHDKRMKVVPISRDLKCSSSCAMFTHEQKEHLLGLIEQELDPENRLLGYIFKVLLPELCLLIFMDEHRMDKSEAVAYLDKRPLDFD